MKKNILLLVLVALVGSLPTTSSFAAGFNQAGMVDPSQDPFAGIPPFPIHPDGTPYNENETAEWQKKADAVVNDYVSKLSEEDKAAFYGQVEELTKVLNTMSEDDWKKVIAETNNMMPQGEFPEPAPEYNEPVASAPQETPTTASEDKKLQAQIDKAVKTITNIITRTERFLRSTSRIHELSGKINQWVSKDKIKEWQVDLTWNKFKGMIEQFNQIMHSFKESKDPKTKKLRYIPALIKDEALSNNLNKISATLTQYEPKVEAPDFGAEKVSQESRAAIKEMLGAYAEAFFALSIMEDLEKIIQTYEPRAQALKEEEAGLVKQSLEAAKKPRTEHPTKIASSPSRVATGYPAGGYATDYGAAAQAPVYPTGGGYYDPGYYGGAYQQAAYPAQGGYYPQPQAGGYGAPAYQDAVGSPVAGGGEGLPSDGQKPTTDATSSSGEQKKAEAGRAEEDYNTNRQLDTLEKQIKEKIVEFFEETEGLDKLGELVTDPLTTSPVTAEIITHIKTLTSGLTKTTGTAKAFKLQIGTLGSDQKTLYTKRAKGVFATHKEALKKLQEQLELAEKKKNSAPATKKYFYFGDRTQKNIMEHESPELAKRLDQTADFAKLVEAMTKFNEAAQAF